MEVLTKHEAQKIDRKGEKTAAANQAKNIRRYSRAPKNKNSPAGKNNAP